MDLDRLVETRLLVQSNSGGGKSRTLRRLLEVTHGQIQHIVFDPEGEFSTLREKFDYVLAGVDGDVPADPKTAALLATKILEARASLIVDLYELDNDARIEFVKNFLTSMINAPKKLWHPAMVVIDEAQIFAPEKAKSESLGAVISLAQRGRKRGYCCVLATQRLSKLHKDVAAECLNKMIGRTNLDLDVNRAADEIGLSKKNALGILRPLKPGHFFAFGPAFGDGVELGQVGDVKTTHGKVGPGFKTKPPAASSKLKKILEQLASIPQEIKAEKDLVAALRDEIKVLRFNTPKSVPANSEQLAAAKAEGWREAMKVAEQAIKEMRSYLRECLDGAVKVCLEEIGSSYSAKATIAVVPKAQPIAAATKRSGAEKTDWNLGACEKNILKFLTVKSGTAFSRQQVAVMTGYRVGSGSFNQAIARLAGVGLIISSGGRVTLATGVDHHIAEILGTDYAPGDIGLKQWVAKLGKCSAAIYQLLLDDADQTYSRAEIADKTGYSTGSGSFNQSISELLTLGLATSEHGSGVRLNPEIQL